MIAGLKFWLECARWYALPMSIFSWVVVFIYAIGANGDVLYGVLALIGICFAHLATNLFDDFIDYHYLSKCVEEDNSITLPNTQGGKCGYLLNNSVSLKEVIKVVALFCLIAFIIGCILTYFAGKTVLLFMLFGGIIVVLYPFMSNIRLSELAVALAYAPILFGGTYYAMTSELSFDVFLLGIPTMIFTVNLLYTDTFLDKDIDKNEFKKTFVGLFKSDIGAINFQKKMLILGYLSVFILQIFDISDWKVFITYLTIPLAIDLVNSLKEYSKNPLSVPEKKWYHFPFENWEHIKHEKSASFMFIMYQARNLMIYFSILLAFGLYFS